MVNFPQLMSQVETTTKNIYACVEEHGFIIKDQENNAYIYLNSPATPTLQTVTFNHNNNKWSRMPPQWQWNQISNTTTYTWMLNRQ